MKISKILLSTALLLITVLFSVNQAGATTVEFNMNVEYSGGTEPEGPDPWATATFVDSGSNNVTLTMSAANLVDSEFISVWQFNFDPDLDPDLLEFTLLGEPGSTPDISTGSDAFKAGPDRFYDIEFDFPPPKGNYENKFTTGETVVYDITYTGSEIIDVYSFSFQSTSDKHGGPFYSAAHIQSIGRKGKSGWVGAPTVVPEPVSSTLFIVGGLALGFRRFVKKRKTH
ncbi:MAG: hypothetical protein ABFR82_06555 [Nitrospirota bacterium]